MGFQSVSGLRPQTSRGRFETSRRLSRSVKFLTLPGARPALTHSSPTQTDSYPMPSTATRPSRQAGFTLIEIMVVIVILGLLATVVVPNVFRALGDSEDTTCRTNMQAIHSAVKNYKLQNRGVRELPSLEDLVSADDGGEAYLEAEEVPIDPWGREFDIREGEGRNKFVIVSAGPDGEFDTEDDLRTDDKREDSDK